MQQKTFYVTKQGFPYWGDGGGRGATPPTSRKFAHSSPTRKNPPHQRFIPSSTPHPPPPPPPPLNNNFLNSHNHSLSYSHCPIKKSPHCTSEKGFSPYPLKLFGKLCPPSFQSINQSFISNQRPRLYCLFKHTDAYILVQSSHYNLSLHPLWMQMQGIN